MPRLPLLLLLLLLLLLACSVARAFVPMSSVSPRTRSPSSTTARAATTARAEAAAAVAAGDEQAATRLRLGVYIEHTDRYAVVYNSNYVKFINRAIHRALGGKQRHAVLRLDGFRFKASARLGHDIEVEVTPKPLKDEGGLLVPANPQEAAAAACPGPDGPVVRVFDAVIREADAPEQVFITAEATTLALPQDRAAWPPVFPATPIPDAMHEVVAAPDKAMDTAVWLDELDVNGLLAPHAVLSMFERGRSDALGGPDRLEELMAEGCMFVVARVDGYRFDPSVPIEEGEDLRVLGRFRRKGASIVACDQVVVTKHEGAHGGRPADTIVAQAVVTLACISAEGEKLMPVPEKALASMSLGHGAGKEGMAA